MNLNNHSLLQTIMVKHNNCVPIEETINSVIPVIQFMNEGITSEEATKQAKKLVAFVYGDSTVNAFVNEVETEEKVIKPEVEYTGIGKIVHDARIKRGYSIIELSRICKVSDSTISDIEHSKKRNFSIDSKRKIGNALNIDILTMTEKFLSHKKAGMLFKMFMDNLMLDVSEISSKTGISRDSINRFIRGISEMTIENFTTVMMTYNISDDDLLNLMNGKIINNKNVITGEKIERFRKNLGLSRTAFAMKLNNFDSSHVQRIETGLTKVSPEFVNDIVEGFKVSREILRNPVQRDIDGIPNDMGDRLEKVRETMNISVSEFVNKMSISEGYYRLIVKNRVQPSEPIVRKISNALNMDIETLIA